MTSHSCLIIKSAIGAARVILRLKVYRIQTDFILHQVKNPYVLLSRSRALPLHTCIL